MFEYIKSLDNANEIKLKINLLTAENFNEKVKKVKNISNPYQNLFVNKFQTKKLTK